MRTGIADSYCGASSPVSGEAHALQLLHDVAMRLILHGITQGREGTALSGRRSRSLWQALQEAQCRQVYALGYIAHQEHDKACK